MPAARDNVVVVGRKSVSDYVLSAILLFNEGKDEIIIKGRGENISKAVDVYNALKARLEDSLELVSVRIDSERVGPRLVSFIEIKVRRVL
ncbi:MAG: DNA-binding protein [Crenarchaeota archaeon]|nr:DNA-binding protein [Thermoproteota archaeon]